MTETMKKYSPQSLFTVPPCYTPTPGPSGSSIHKQQEFIPDIQNLPDGWLALLYGLCLGGLFYLFLIFFFVPAFGPQLVLLRVHSLGRGVLGLSAEVGQAP